jgi:GDP/UDP-N,N'-diacetylbacillosamine 2-epimerase (hydrolysing)
MSKYLFVSTDVYKNRAEEIHENNENIFMVGALSVDNLTHMDLYSIDEFKQKFSIDLNVPYILSTFHPETVSLEKNELYTDELLKAFNTLSQKYKIIITMPNADTMGLMVRGKIETFSKNRTNVHLVESFGIKGYLSCMKHCSFMLGNTSSGFVEAAFFPRWVLNIGNRQDGRIRTPNIIDCEPDEREILSKVKSLENAKTIPESNIYGQGNTAQLMIEQLKKLLNAG